MPGADLNVFFTVLMDVIEMAFVIAVIAGFSMLEKRELCVTTDALEPTGVLALEAVVVLVRELVCAAFKCLDWMDSMISLRGC
jgi:hypothetical protein